MLTLIANNESHERAVRRARRWARRNSRVRIYRQARTSSLVA